MIGESGRVRLEYVGGGRWRVSVLCRSGKVAAVDGDLVTAAGLARRADRLLALWSAVSAALSTIPPPSLAPHPRHSHVQIVAHV